MTYTELEAAAAEDARRRWAALSDDERREFLRGRMADNPPDDTELANAYIEYVATVSPDWMAMSFCAAGFLTWLCSDRKPRVVADFGSGFSSFVLRRYAARSGAQVISVDDSAEWLDKTREFLERYDLATDGLMLWDDWATSDGPRLDLAFHDLASGDLRESSMWKIADRMRVGGLIVFDDAQHEGHMREMTAVGNAHGWSLACLPETIDGNGRFEAMMVCRASSTP